MKYALVLIAVVGLISCFGKDEKQAKAPCIPEYDLTQPEKILVGEEMDEISGIVYVGGDTPFVSLNDEEGKFYRITTTGKTAGKPFKFSKKGDYEDLCFDGRYWYAIKSNGELMQVKNAFTDSSRTREFIYPEEGNEFETVFYDQNAKKIVLIMKTPLHFPDGRIPAFVLDTATGSFTPEPQYSPDTISLRRFMPNKKAELKPTAAAIHPITGELYILSSKERAVVVMKNGKMVNACKLGKDIFRQPEGLCFAPNGDMYISNEAQDAIGNILKFAWHPERSNQH